ncbi:MAG: anthranilate phosphoribosyltransferase [Fibrobacteres bacterium]|nr:anthranilate phosphoribosyltransferase [Fibrobacterota bacterium]
MTIQEALNLVVENRDLTESQATEIAGVIMRGEATQAQIGGFLVALRMKGETVEEIAGFVQAMRANAVKCPVTIPVVDIVGTGGDHSGTFNISTTTAFVVAGAGGAVAKHGNRGVSSRSGSADVLAHLGVSLELAPEQVARCVETAGVGFLFAQSFHPAMRHVGPARREMTVRTVFNLLGPMTNPAGTKRLVIGVFAKRWCRPLAEALAKLGTEKAWVVHGSDGLDEITTTGPTWVAEWDGTSVREFEIDPGQVGLRCSTDGDLKGGEPPENAAILRAILEGQTGPKRDIVVLNAAAALLVLGLAPSLAEGVRMAQESIDSRLALASLEKLVALSKEMRP